MNPSARPQRATLWSIALAAIIALALVARLIPGERTIDDAFITFRYARNLLSGHGFVYNPGERVQGTTTPLYTLLMAGEKALLPPVGFPMLSIVTNALADAASIAALALLCKRVLKAPWLGIASGALWAVAPMSVTFAIGGMETSVYILLLLLAFSCYAMQHPTWSALFCALATLTRPDALIAVLPLFAHMTWDRRRIPWREGAVYIATLAPWVLFATLYFGSPLANSIVAKTSAYRLDPYSALVRLIQHYATPFFEHQVFHTSWVGIGAIMYPFLSLAGTLTMFHREQKLLPLALYPWLYIAAFGLSNPLIFRWYMTPILPMYVLCILCGVRRVVYDLLRAITWMPLARQIVLGLLLFAALGMLLNSWTLHPDHGPDRPAPEMAWFKLEQLYRRATLELKADQPITDQTLIAAGDIGVIGFTSGARILDTVGLVSPQSTAYYPLPEQDYVITYAMATELILDQQPDYIITLEVYVRNTLSQSEAFEQQYTLHQKWPTDIYGSEGMLVYRKKP
jgi:hypothetical protein